jgi:hypothetical protein
VKPSQLPTPLLRKPYDQPIGAHARADCGNRLPLSLIQPLMPPFVTQLRTPAEAISLGAAGAPTITIRVQLLEAWDAVKVNVEPSTPVATVKARALGVLAPDIPQPADVVTKLGGFEIRDESKSLADAGVKDGSTLLLHMRRRQPLK